ncbi:MAG: hypothetical protein NC090_04925 [Anaeroplasma bactoclasticum]|nr:hypothetical protein [Anaeroplasma bactoclasticum]
MNRHEFIKPNKLNNDMKRKFDDRTEFAEEFHSRKLFQDDGLFDNEIYILPEEDKEKKKD